MTISTGSTGNMSRRALLAGAPALAAAAAAPAVAAGAEPHPDANLLDLGRQWEAAFDHAETPGLTRNEEAFTAACDALTDLEEMIVEIPARTIEGAAVRAMIIRLTHPGYDDDSACIATRGLTALIADVERLGAAKPAAPALAAAVVPAADEPHLDARLVELGRRWKAAIDHANASTGDELTERSLATNAIEDELMATPARTFSGLAVKVAILRYNYERELEHADECLAARSLLSVIEDVERLAGMGSAA